MYKIYLDTTDRHKKSATLVKDGKIISEVSGDKDPVVMTRELLTKAKLKPSDIYEYEANPGPGSFTGIKIGITIANVLNWALGRKSVKQLQTPEYGSEPNIHQTKWLQ
jgi:tRNA A37 threonylcarbamoyladenosine modification protein TsaB